MTVPALAPDGVLSWTDVVLRLLAATGIGGAIGLNRELTRKPAGLRTHALVALGAALATVSALQLGDATGVSHGDAASRVIQGIVAGIGFIGGGVILHTENRNVVGLTTAATIWVAAALGISCAVGQWRVAGSAVLIALVVLVVGLTTAATIWVAAALGISCAVGQWRVAGSAVLIALVVLVVGRGIEGALHRIKGDTRDGGNRGAGDEGNRERGTGNSASRSG